MSYRKPWRSNAGVAHERPARKVGRSARHRASIERPLRFIEVPEHGDDAGEFEVEAGLIAKNEKTGQTNVQFKSLSTGGSIGSLSDAEDQANEAKNQEAPRGNSQASEEAEEAKRQDGQCRSPEKGTPLAVQHRPQDDSRRELSTAFRVCPARSAAFVAIRVLRGRRTGQGDGGDKPHACAQREYRQCCRNQFQMSHDNFSLLVGADRTGYGVNSTYESCRRYAQCAAASVRLRTYRNISSASGRIAGRCGHVAQRAVPAPGMA